MATPLVPELDELDVLPDDAALLDVEVFGVVDVGVVDVGVVAVEPLVVPAGDAALTEWLMPATSATVRATPPAATAALATPARRTSGDLEGFSVMRPRSGPAAQGRVTAGSSRPQAGVWIAHAGVKAGQGAA